MTCLDIHIRTVLFPCHFFAYYFDTTDQHLIKNTLAELYRNLSYITLSGGRDFGFNNVSDLLARISLLRKVPVCKTLKKGREKSEKMLLK